VLTLVARGLTDRAIGRQLAILKATVKTHLVRVFAKLGVTDCTSAVTAVPDVGDRPAPTRRGRRAARRGAEEPARSDQNRLG
jgi:regulatory LuxR family protein